MQNRLGRWTSSEIRVRLISGKCKGTEVTLPDIPHIIERHDGKLAVLLPGMEGEAVQLPEKTE